MACVEKTQGGNEERNAKMPTYGHSLWHKSWRFLFLDSFKAMGCRIRISKCVLTMMGTDLQTFARRFGKIGALECAKEERARSTSGAASREEKTRQDS